MKLLKVTTLANNQSYPRKRSNEINRKQPIVNSVGKVGNSNALTTYFCHSLQKLSEPHLPKPSQPCYTFPILLFLSSSLYLNLVCEFRHSSPQLWLKFQMKYAHTDNFLITRVYFTFLASGNLKVTIIVPLPNTMYLERTLSWNRRLTLERVSTKWHRSHHHGRTWHYCHIFLSNQDPSKCTLLIMFDFSVKKGM